MRIASQLSHHYIISGWQKRASRMGQNPEYWHQLLWTVVPFLIIIPFILSIFFLSLCTLHAELNTFSSSIHCISTAMFWALNCQWTRSPKGGEAGQHLRFHPPKTELQSLSPGFQIINVQLFAAHALSVSSTSAFFLNPCFPRIGPLVISLEKLVLVQAFTHEHQYLIFLPGSCELLSPGNTALVVCSCYSVVEHYRGTAIACHQLHLMSRGHDTVTGPLHMRTHLKASLRLREVPWCPRQTMRCPNCMNPAVISI